MAGIDYLLDIRRSIGPGENAEDVVAMIDILAQARTFEQRRVDQNDFQFAAVIWCVIWQPMKPPTYRSAIVQVRRFYAGVATNFQSQARLRQSFTPRLLEAPDERTAIAQGVEALFNLPTVIER